MNRWNELRPEARMVRALDAADARGARSKLIACDDAPAKNNWSNRFADACAKMVADAVRAHRFSKDLTVLPDPDGSAEPPTIVIWDKGQKRRKKIDVIVGDLVAGLQVAISLKGAGFRDLGALNYDKNLTGRLYELENEARQLHAYRPQAIVVGIYYLPLASVCDKRSTTSPSSFAHAVQEFRRITGRTDPRFQDDWHHVDLGFVGLYVPGDPEDFQDEKKGRPFTYSDPFPRGVVRYFEVTRQPPMRGRPRIESTSSLEEVVARIAGRYTGESHAERMEWAVCEEEPPYSPSSGG